MPPTFQLTKMFILFDCIGGPSLRLEDDSPEAMNHIDLNNVSVRTQTAGIIAGKKDREVHIKTKIIHSTETISRIDQKIKAAKRSKLAIVIQSNNLFGFD